MGQAATILGEGRGPTKGEGPCVISHRGISPFDEFAATTTTLAWKEGGSYKGSKGKNPVKTKKKGNKQGTHPFVDPELRTRSEIETQSRSPQGQRRKQVRKNEKRNDCKE